MTFLKGLLTTFGTVVALLIATIVFFGLKMRSIAGGEGQTGIDVKALWALTVHSPLYWLTVVILMGASVWLFRHWVLSS